jgi:hypothetical protein
MSAGNYQALLLGNYEIDDKVIVISRIDEHYRFPVIFSDNEKTYSIDVYPSEIDGKKSTYAVGIIVGGKVRSTIQIQEAIKGNSLEPLCETTSAQNS